MNKPSRGLTVLLCVLLVLPPELAYGWGNEGHIAINRVAAMHIPASMPLFLRRATARIAYFGPEPDRWRSRTEPQLKEAQEPDHFIDMELLHGMELPLGRYDFYKIIYERWAKAGSPEKSEQYPTPDKIGLQPYATLEVYGRLVTAFRQYRKQRREHKPSGGAEQAAIFYAGWLGHYVADGAQPLHTTVNYNGWTGSNPNGYTTSRDTHWLFEGPFVAHNLARMNFSADVHEPVRLANPFQDYMQFLRDSNSQVQRFYELEKTGAFKDRGTPEGLAFTRARLAAGAQMLLNLWYTAWLESEKEEIRSSGSGGGGR